MSACRTMGAFPLPSSWSSWSACNLLVSGDLARASHTPCLVPVTLKCPCVAHSPYSPRAAEKPFEYLNGEICEAKAVQIGQGKVLCERK